MVPTPEATLDADRSDPALGRAWLRTGVGYTATRMLGQGTEFVAFVLFARQLGADGFGAFWLAFLAARYLGLVGDWGANLRGARDVAARVDPGHVVALLRRRAIMSTTLGVAYAAVLVAAGRPALALLAVCIVGRGASRDWMRLGNGAGTLAGLPSVVQGTTLLVLAVLVRSPAQVAAATAAAYGIALLVSILLNPAPERRAVGARPTVEGWLLAGSLADQVSQTADSFLLGGIVSLQAAGVYGAVYRLPNAAATVVGLVTGVLTARLASVLRQDPSRGPAELRRALGVSLRVAGGLVLCAPVARALVVPLLGDPYRSGQTAAALLFLALAVVCAGAPLHASVLARGDDRRYVLALAGAAVVNVVANLVLIPRFELSGAALATLISSSVLLVALIHLVRSSPHRT